MIPCESTDYREAVAVRTATQPRRTRQPGDIGLVDEVEFYRLDAGRSLSAERRAEFGQFLTPSSVARFMATLLQPTVKKVRLLDPGAGVGSLAAAAIEELLSRPKPPEAIELTVYEVDPGLCEYLARTIDACRMACRARLVGFQAELIAGDFIAAAGELLPEGGLFPKEQLREFDCAILNPPYRKINSDSEIRRLLSQIGIETSNLYTAFLWLTLRLLSPTGEMVAITPRSFCNGPYFRPFRDALLANAYLSRIHLFGSRRKAFSEDAVLQENIIFRAKRPSRIEPTLISTSPGPDDPDMVIREVSPEQVITTDNVIHVTPDELQSQVAERIREFTTTLSDLDAEVSTGRVVDFRAREFLAFEASDCKKEFAPLVYPMHVSQGRIVWPRNGRKPNCLRIAADTKALLVPQGVYVLVKRFSAKEEKRRVVAALCRPEDMPDVEYAFENHLNYFHRRGAGLPIAFATGLAVYLNSSLLDAYFRQFSGHTQVNASDLRNLPYPDFDALERIGRAIGDSIPSQKEIDSLLSMELSNVAKDPLTAKSRIDEALEILKLLGLPRAQQNNRSALTLLALTGIKPDTAWSDASSPLMGITPIMDFAKNHYGTTYAPNTRETFRRQTMHQFVEAGIALYNPDKPDRAVNSPKAVYQIAPLLLDVLRMHGTKQWEPILEDWLAQVGTLKKRYARERNMAKIPLKLPTGQQVELSPGGQNILVEKLIHQFCPHFTPGGVPIYVGDTEEKYAFFDKYALDTLGVNVDSHGKMPDVVIHHVDKNWLLLIEAVTSHGPVDGKRRDELNRLFAKSKAPLVFVTAFMDRAAMVRFLGDISWETEVWVADAPTHMIHFNGERFLGPYDT